MKKYSLLLAAVSVLLIAVIGLSGCMEVPEEDATYQDETQMQDEVTKPADEEMHEESQMSFKIENFENYEDADIDTFGLTPCISENEEADKFIANAEAGGIKQLVLLDVEGYTITLYLTANPDKVDTKKFKELVNPCIEGAGMVGALKAFDDHLLWGNYMCSSGVALTEDQPGYENFLACTGISKEIEDYLNTSEEGFQCPPEGATIDCEPVAVEEGEELAPEIKEHMDYCEWAKENCKDAVFAL